MQIDSSDDFDANMLLNVEGIGVFGDDFSKKIQEEIETWKDLGKLEQQAMKFKPKLDKMQEKVLAKKLQQQEAKKKQKENAILNSPG